MTSCRALRAPLRPFLLALCALPGLARADEGQAAAESPAPATEEAPAQPEADPQLRGPLDAPRNSFFYSTLGIPPLRDAHAQGAGVFSARLRLSESYSKRGGQDTFDAAIWEWSRIELTLGLLDRVDLNVTCRVSGWDEHLDDFSVHDRGSGYLVVQGEQQHHDLHVASSRHENLSDVSAGLLVQWWQGAGGQALATSLLVKAPGFRRRDLTNSGTTDLAATVLLTLPLGQAFTLHANLGAVIPLGDSWLFEHKAESIAGLSRRLQPFPQGGLVLTWAPTNWLAFSADVEGAGVAFTEPRVLSGPPFSTALGARLRWGPLAFELGGGTGLTKSSVDVFGWIGVSFFSSPLWGDKPQTE